MLQATDLKMVLLGIVSFTMREMVPFSYLQE